MLFMRPPNPPKEALEPDSSKIPTVWVSTKKDGTNILISVRDNGNGIPEKIKDKIFQPFLLPSQQERNRIGTEFGV
jgi:signal transduction histidine kinase